MFTDFYTTPLLLVPPRPLFWFQEGVVELVQRWQRTVGEHHVAQALPDLGLSGYRVGHVFDSRHEEDLPVILAVLPV